MNWLPSFQFSLQLLNGQINEGWLAHYKRQVHIDDILRPPSTCENGYEEEEIEWLQRTVQYYVSQMFEEQREKKGITALQALQILRKATRTLPYRPMASAADGRDSAADIAGRAIRRHDPLPPGAAALPNCKRFENP